MSAEREYLKLYTTKEKPFSGYSKDFDKADYVVLGVPYDRTSTYRQGSALAPTAIREASNNIETYSLRSNIDIEDIAICDVGNLDVVDSVSEILRRLELCISDIHNSGKIPIILGGEHTLTYASVKALKNDIGIVDFDAHMDLRDEYMGEKLSHTTFMRRICEEVGADRIIEVGTRAVSKEELKFANEAGVKFYSTYDVRKHGAKKISSMINSAMSGFKKKYVTIDVDVLDPAYAPGVGNPEAEGLDTSTIIEILKEILDLDIVGIDVVEFCPNYDNGATASQVAKILFEILATIENKRR
ncbi:agmatinase [[Eubacterium] cellulosolvens]